MTTTLSFAQRVAHLGAATAMSRLFGFARDVLVASALGAGPVADAFVVAFRLPNVIRRLLAEGAFSNAFVPLYNEAKSRGEETTFARQTFTLVTLVFGLAVAAGIIAMPWLLRLIAPGFSDDIETSALVVSLARIAFPYCLICALMAVAMAALHAEGRIAEAAYVPSFLNVVLILAVILAHAVGFQAAISTAYALAFAILAGGLLQLAALLAALHRARMRLGFAGLGLSPRLIRFAALALPGLATAGITQVNALVALVIGSSQRGAITWLHYADRIYQLPLGIVGVAIGIALLPDLARHLALGDKEAERHAFSRAVEFATFLSLPAAIGLFVAAEPVVVALFERGAFTPADSQATATALSSFAIGLPAFVAAKVLQPLFFARMHMRLPFLVALAGAAVDILAALGLFPLFGHAGIAAAAALSGWVNALGLGFVAWRQGLVRLDRSARRRLPRLVLAGLLMGVATSWVASVATPWLHGVGDLLRFGLVLGLAGLAFALFVTVSFALGALDKESVRAALRGSR